MARSKGMIRRLAVAATALAMGSIPVGSAVASAAPLPTAPGSWGTIVMPSNFYPSWYNYYGVDAAGNVYYSPSLNGPALRANLRAHASTSHVSLTIPIDRYSPATGTTTYQSLTGMTSIDGLAVDPTGNVDAIAVDATLNAPVIVRLGAGGQSTLTASIPNPLAIAADAAGDVFVASFTGSTSIYEIRAAGGPPVLAASGIANPILSLAVAPDGTLYAAAAFAGNVTYAVTPAGGVSVVSALSGETTNVAVDAAGNVFAAEPIAHVVQQMSPGGALLNLPIAPTGVGSVPVLLAIGGSSLFMWDDAAPHNLYTWATAGNIRPTLTSVTSSATRLGSRYVQSVTATWTGTGTAFLCTLMYGFNASTSFTQRTSTRSCTFTNLDLGRSYGISVVALSGSVASAASVGFAPAPVVTLTCVRHGVTRHVSGVNPRCPAGWRQV